jgi:DNA topoisomerase-3
MLRYAESSECRMLGLVRHFGDREDRRGACAICDFCAPAECVAQCFRDPAAAERDSARRILQTLRKSGPVAAGRLHAELCSGDALDRKTFEQLLNALARAGLVELADASFEKDGKRIEFRKAALTPQGRAVDGQAELPFTMKQDVPRTPRAARKGKRKRSRKAAAAPARAPGVEEALRAWRLAEAKRRTVPAFRILTDKALHAIAEQQPASAAELIAIPGVGLSTIEKYGAQIFRILDSGRSGRVSQ